MAKIPIKTWNIKVNKENKQQLDHTCNICVIFFKQDTVKLGMSSCNWNHPFHIHLTGTS